MAITGKKRMVYLTIEAPREGQASYTHVHEMIKGLQDCGWDVRLYQPAYTARQQSPGLLARLFHSLVLQYALWRQWRRGSVLYVRSHYLAFPSALIARIFGIPVFHEINGPYGDVFIAHPSIGKFRKILVPMQRIQYKWARGLIAVTQELCDWAVRESGGKPCCLISNAANTDLFHAHAAKPDGLPENYVVFFGGLARWHGVPVMMDAVAHADWPAGVDLVIVGDGACSDMVRSRAETDRRIHMMGRRAYRDIPGYVAHAAAGLVPINNPDGRSDTGLFPLKLYETLACGIPAIVTDFPGQADFVREHECGLVIPVDDSGALARAVAHINRHPDEAKAMGKRAEAIIAAAHSWKIRARQTDEWVESLTA